MLAKDMKYLIEDFGQTATFRKVTVGAYSPSTGSVSNTTQDYSIKAYMSQYTLSELNADNILRGDRKALIPSYDINGASLPSPDEGDLVLGVGDTSRVVASQTLYSGEQVVCYICQVRE